MKKRRQLQRHLSDSKKRKRKRQPKNFESPNEEYTNTGVEASKSSKTFKLSKAFKFSKSMSLSMSLQPTISLGPPSTPSSHNMLSAPSKSNSKPSKHSSSCSSFSPSQKAHLPSKSSDSKSSKLSSSSSSPSQKALVMSKSKANNDKPTMTPPSTTTQMDCSRQKNCSSCLENKYCAHWTAGQCHASCAVADTSCYTNDGIYTNLSVDEICNKANNDSRDRAICNRMSDCTSCIESIKSDGEKCMWFEEDGYCDVGCNNMSGCGSRNVVTCLFATTTITSSTWAATIPPTGSSDVDFSDTSSPTQTSKTLPAVPDAPSSGCSSYNNNFLLVCILSTIICMVSFLL